MTTTWEYKAVTVRPAKSFWSLGIASDEDVGAALNREGAQGWELVNAIRAAPSRPLQLLFKRPR